MNSILKAAYVAAPVVIAASGALASADNNWRPAQLQLETRWSRLVSPSNALPEYPRPQLVRKAWLNLNGLWDFAIRKSTEGKPTRYSKQILVPFPVESALSGIAGRVLPSDRVWYRRSFELGKSFAGKLTILHFGAVDWETEVFVDGQKVGEHRGGYDPFSFDITSALGASKTHEIVVAVRDETGGDQPKGKQVLKPGGIMYTPTSGIWQTVWLEPVSETSIESLHLVPDLDRSELSISPNVRGSAVDVAMEVSVFDGKQLVAKATGSANSTLHVAVPKPKLWTPDSPFLYSLKVVLKSRDQVLDSVDSYFGMRKIEVGKDEHGVTRLLLNGAFVFQNGLLDQGFWPDGLYTAPTDAALKFDIQAMKNLGFNLLRKHVKVEPSRWYYWCDKLGMLVWQDMPSAPGYIGGNDPDLNKKGEAAQQFEVELKALIDAFRNHPSIVLWVVFNEGWGQYDTERLTNWVKSYDPSRLADNASGWTDRGVGDVHDVHIYPGPGSPKPEPTRAAVLGEYGGLGLGITGHTWQKETWGYQGMADKKGLTQRYVELMHNVYKLKASSGLSSSVYTQVTDVETECNGLYTYDRAVLKLDAKLATDANKGVFPPEPKVVPILRTSETEPQTWRYTLMNPGSSWMLRNADDSSWSEAPGGFGTVGTPGAIVRTTWNSADIWLRRTFDMAAKPWGTVELSVYHDEDAEIYINGVLAVKLGGYGSEYSRVPISGDALKALMPKGNVIAVHCHQTSGGQGIDVGVVSVFKPTAR